jgi:5-methylcytosine-specific restriction endonuclease McrA
MPKKKASRKTTDARGRTRDYRKEYDRDHAGPTAKKRRAKRNTARKRSGLKKGDSREVDHKRPLSKGGSNRRSNVRVTSRRANRTKAAKRGR